MLKLFDSLNKKEKGLAHLLDPDSDVMMRHINWNLSFLYPEIVRLSYHPRDNVPPDILHQIFLRLSIRNVVKFMLVCKRVRNVISCNEFYNQFYDECGLYLILRRKISSNLYLIELEQNSNFTRMVNCLCGYWKDPFIQTSDCKCKQTVVELKCRMKLPIWNYRRKYNIFNTCNGFLGLADMDKNPFMVYDPVKGDFVILPRQSEFSEGVTIFVACALGFCSNSNRYKVVRVFRTSSSEYDRVSCSLSSLRYEVLTLGTKEWREIGVAPPIYEDLAWPTVFGGAVHWIWLQERLINYVLSFNFEKETFSLLYSPFIPLENRLQKYVHGESTLTLGLLSGSLCICIHDHNTKITVSIQQKDLSWVSVFSISLSTPNKWPSGSYRPIKYTKNCGGLWMYNCSRSALILFERNRPWIRIFKFEGEEAEFELVELRPSFISLEQSLAGNDVAIMNISSRCRALTLEEDERCIYLKEQED